ncbi:class C beta-lactamase-related serine hydrolase [Alginatibacterium sediminis]|uniref:Class C beta-lactamase-related serine hydrolase n=1 Tax=Alginatibacterium sediminis TaxID=2164068 RepID=A0A420E8W8_9ALTE|nr:serine hydrolase [Alginatibacterium sediminis]RKF15827.1 class C beta-lactamase-related serine hydrolase [Alginatibacterium sediminis]
MNDINEFMKGLLSSQYSNITGLIAIRSGKVGFEYYAPGFSSQTPIHLSSVTKSITSMLFGVALKQGHIKSVEQPILDFFPDYSLKRGEKTLPCLRLKDLLSMTAPYKFKNEPYARVYSSRDWTLASLDLLGGKGEVGQFKYTTPALHVLSGVLSTATGQRVADFANQHLFAPLGIAPVENITLSDRQQHLEFTRGASERGWVADPCGANTPGWGLVLSTSDLIKLASLYLGKGCWDEQRLLSRAWIQQSTSEQSRWGERRYGYLWWMMPETETETETENNGYCALGDGGNALFILPKDEVVVAITSRFVPRPKDRVTLFTEHLLPLLAPKS